MGACATFEKMEGSESSRAIAPHLLIVSTFDASFLPSPFLRVVVRFFVDPVRCASHSNSLAIAITRGLVATFV